MADTSSNTSASGSSPAAGWQAPSAAEMQPLLPQYEILEILGRGGMGAVYKVRQKSLKRLVAIKILPPEAADDEFKFMERFRNEAATMAQLNHPAIVNVHDFGEIPHGLLYFVMEFVDGTDLQKIIQASGRLEPEHALRITVCVCDALAYAHKRGVIHRDIKPANILIDPEGQVKVADFGLAKMHDPSRTSGLTRSDMAMGTPDYVAPEVLSPGMTADHRADLYAVGVMLYQMLTGEVPRGMFKLPSERTPGSDPRFDEIICKAMEHDREERYQTASDVRQALESIRTTPLARHQNSGAGAWRSRAMPGALPAPASPGRLKWGAAAAGAVALGIAAFFALNRDKAVPGSLFKTAVVQPVKVPGSIPGASPWSDQLAVREWRSPWIFEGGILRSTDKNPTAYLGRMADGALRVRFQPEPEKLPSSNNPPLQISLRSTYHDEEAAVRGTYQIQIYPDRRVSHLLYLAKGRPGQKDPPPEYLWKDKPWPDAGASADLEIRAQGGELTLLQDGETVASAHDSRVPAGSCVMMASPGVRILKLETRGVVKETEAAPVLPKITQWRDVTESVRARARAIPELVVEADSVRHVGSGKTVDISLMEEGAGDRAVWVRYVGDAQVSFWFKSSRSSAFVLAQRAQTIFKRAEKGAPASTDLRPAVRHPAAYDALKSHELLVAVQGATVRAWLDGRFVGEARDPDIPGSSTALVFTKFSDVRKVEVGEVEPPSESWTDWLGPKLATGFTSQGWVVEEGGVSTDLPLKGAEIMPLTTRDGVIRATFVMRDSEGVMLTVRETSGADGRHLYLAQYTGKNLYIAHRPPDVTATVRLVNEPVSEELRALPEHTLEFRFEGDELTAVLDGRQRISTRHSLLSHGISAAVLTKGVLLKKLETRPLDSPRAAGPPAAESGR